jgi:hypothetical protein
LPIDLEHIWRWFQRLDSTRPRGENGTGAISETELGWFFRNRGIQPAPWEVDLLAALDMLALQQQDD